MSRFEDALELARSSQNYLEFLEKIAANSCRVLELGTEFGISAARFAQANPQNVVVTVDVNPLSKQHVRELGFANIIPITGDSRVSIHEVSNNFDILFVDADHTFNSAWNDYSIYRNCVRPGGLILLDDIAYCPGMEVVWELVPERKERLDWLHYRGFGLVEKQEGVLVPKLGDVIAESLRRIWAKEEAQIVSLRPAKNEETP